MSRAISGTKDLKNRTVLKQPEGGTGRMRCPSCQGIATATYDATTGVEVHKCQKCGRSYTKQAM